MASYLSYTVWLKMLFVADQLWFMTPRIQEEVRWEL